MIFYSCISRQIFSGGGNLYYRYVYMLAKIKSFKRNPKIWRVQMASLSPVTAITKVLCTRTTFEPRVLEKCVKFNFFFSKNVVQKTYSPRYDNNNNNNNDIIYLLIIISLHRILSYIHPKIYARRACMRYGHPSPQSFKSPRQVVRSPLPHLPRDHNAAACCQFHSRPAAPHRRRRRLQ